MAAIGIQTLSQGAEPELVRAQLERILASPSFGQAESLIRLLRYLVAETLAGHTDRLKEYTLGVEVFQRGTDFDPRIDTIVRTQVRRLRAKLQHYYCEEGKLDQIVIGLPKGRYVPSFQSRPDPQRYPLRSVPAIKGMLYLKTPGCRLCLGVLALVVTIAALSRTWQASPGGLERVQADTAFGVPGALRISSAQRSGAGHNPEVYRLYLKGRFGPKTPESLAYLDRALAIDPEYAPAWMAKAEFYLGQNWRAGAAPSVILPKAREAAARVIELGYDVPEAHVVLATVAESHDWDWERAEYEYHRALQMDPHLGWARLRYAQLLAVRGRISEAIDQVQRIGSVGATGSALATGPAAIYYFARQYDRAIEHCRAVVDASPEMGDCHYWMGRAFLSKGMPSEALKSLVRRSATPGQGFGSVVTAYLAAGHRAQALRLRGEVESRASRTYVSPVSLAQVYFAFGEEEAGFRELERALEFRDQSLPTLKVEPAYDAIRSDPRFQRILEKLRI